jgi:superfamily II DNA/RNA helicase
VLPAIASCRWDVVIVDEAHGVAAGSDRRRAVDSICRRTPYVLLLTATPHNGDRTAFASLCDLGMLANDRLVVFRRSRHELALGPGRRIHRLLIRPSSAERRMHERLATFRQSIAADGNKVNRDVWLALAVLHKRSLSSARSLEQSVSRRLSILAAGDNDGMQQLALPLDEGGGELDARDQPPPWTLGTLIDQSSERKLLEPLVESARLAAAGETKLARLRRLLRRLQRLEESAIVFTEYRDTLAHVRRALRGDCAVLHGGLTHAERRAELDHFSTGRRTVLLATDAAGEGLNLHHRCRIVINLELPWNPTRLEQRIGRVDRIGQRRRVHVFHLIARDTGEIRIMDYLRERIAAAQADIATPDPLGNIESVHDEVAIARLIMAGESGGRGFSEADLERRRRETGSGSPTSPLLQPALTRDAALEHARLVQARSFSMASGEAVASGFDRMAAFARRTTVRQHLGDRLLAVLQTILEDPYGRTVASRLVPVLIELSRPRGNRLRRSSMRRIAQELEARAPARTAGEDRAWQDVHGAFWANRRQREIDIAAVGDSRNRHDLVQASLFEMRALRAHADRTDVDAEQQAESARRIAAASARELQLTPARAVLLLFPPR